MIFVNDYPDEKLDNIYSKYIEVSCISYGYNKGIHGARVEGLNKAKGKYILFLDQDDEIVPEWMLSQLKHIGDSAIVVCNGIYRNGRIIYDCHATHLKSISKNHLEEYKIISPGQALIRKSCIPAEWSHHILKYNGGDDFYLWLLLFSRDYKFCCNDDILYTHNEGSYNQSFRWKEMEAGKQEILDTYKKSPLAKLYIEKYLENLVKNISDKYRPYIFFDEITTRKGYVECGYINVIIYGMGIYGNKLLKLLQDNLITVVCGVDMDANVVPKKDIMIYKPGTDLPPAEIMIVTAEFAYEEIEESYKTIIKTIRMTDFLKQFYVCV